MYGSTVPFQEESILECSSFYLHESCADSSCVSGSVAKFQGNSFSDFPLKSLESIVEDHTSFSLSSAERVYIHFILKTAEMGLKISEPRLSAYLRGYEVVTC
jgi:hypothetical protein